MAPSIAQEATGSGSLSPVCSRSKDAFHSLVSELSSILGPSSGLDSSEIDVQQLFTLMDKYESTERDWKCYAFSDLSRGYTRNLVDEGNGKSNLLVLVWTPGKGSPIHDHADAHCLMKVLRGSLKETRFSFPGTDKPLQNIKDTIFKENEVTYMSDELGLHRISNPDLDNVAVSLHLYTPPNAAREGCNIFDEKTSRSSHVTQSNFYSVYGRKV